MFGIKKKIEDLKFRMEKAEKEIKYLKEIQDMLIETNNAHTDAHNRLLKHLGLAEETIPGTPEKTKIMTIKEAENIRKERDKQEQEARKEAYIVASSAMSTALKSASLGCYNSMLEIIL